MSKHYKKELVKSWRGQEPNPNPSLKGREEGSQVCVVCGGGAMRCVEPPLCEKHLEMVSLICQAERLNARRATLEDVLSMAVLVRGKMVLTRRELPNVYRDVMVNYWEKENG